MAARQGTFAHSWASQHNTTIGLNQTRVPVGGHGGVIAPSVPAPPSHLGFLCALGEDGLGEGEGEGITAIGGEAEAGANLLLGV